MREGRREAWLVSTLEASTAKDEGGKGEAEQDTCKGPQLFSSGAQT